MRQERSYCEMEEQKQGELFETQEEEEANVMYSWLDEDKALTKLCDGILYILFISRGLDE